MDNATAALLAQVQKWGVPIRHRRSERGTFIFTPNEPATHLFIVQEGCLRLYRHGRSGKEVVVRWCSKDDLLGEEAVTGKVYCSFAHAITPTKVAQIPVKELLQLLTKRPEVGALLQRALAETLEKAAEVMTILQGEEMPWRLASALVWLAHRLGEPRKDGQVCVPFTHAQLAALLGSPRECVTVNLRTLQAYRLTTVKRGQVQVHLPALQEWLRNHSLEFG